MPAYDINTSNKRPCGEARGEAISNSGSGVLFDREVDGTDDEVLEAVESLKTKGFINFYGTQPFGNNSVFLRGVGCELLKGNWQQVRMFGKWRW